MHQSFEQIIFNVTESVSKKTLEENYKSLVSKCRALNISSYAIHAFLNAKNKSNSKSFNSELETKNAFIKLEPDGKNIGDCNLCATKREHNNLVSQSNEISLQNTVLSTQNSNLERTISELESSRKFTPLPWVLFGIITIVCIVLGVNLSSTSSQLDRANGNLSNEQAKVRSLNNEMISLKENLQSIGNKLPIIITDIQVANTYEGGSIMTDYGNTIYEDYTMYLNPKIFYKAIASGSKTLYVKLYKPNGELSRGDSSPYGYSNSTSISINGDGSAELTGWGNSTKGTWSSGTYRYEIWYSGTCLGSKTFTIY